MKTARSGSSPIPSISRSASKLCSWRPKALRRADGVEEAEVVGVANDQAGAGAEDRPPGLVVGAQRRLQLRRLDALGDRRALAAGDDEAVEAGQVGGPTDLGYFGAELAQGAGVSLEAALQR